MRASRRGARATLWRRVWAAAAAIGLAGCGGDPAPPPRTGDGLDRLDTVVADAMRQWDVPGGALAVAYQGRLVVARGYGFSDLARSRPVEPSDLFRVASVSKSLTGLATLRALDLGLLDLDERVFARLARLRDPERREDPRLLEIRVEHLLHHAGGWTLWGVPDDPLLRNKEIARSLQVPSPPGPEDLVRWLALQPLSFEPGSRYSYTNIGYVALGRVLAAAAGRPYEEFVREELLAPAGSTRPRLGAIRREDRLPGEVEYEAPREEFWENVFDGESGSPASPAYGGLNLEGFDASSAWVVSVVDLARLGVAVDGRPDRPDVLLPETQAMVFRNLSPPGETPYGPGLFVATPAQAAAGGLRRVAFGDHSGAMPGTTAYFAVWEDGVVIAAAFNASRGDGFSNSVIAGLRRETNALAEWPAHDLFDRFP